MFEFYLFEMLFGSPWEAIEVVAVSVFFANLITVCLPNHSDNKVIQFGIDTLNALSMNILRNANRLYPKHFELPSKKKKVKAKTHVGHVDDRRVGGSEP